MFINDDSTKEVQIKQILSIVKIAALAFSAVAFLQHIYANYSNIELLMQSGMLVAFVLTAVLGIYVIWIVLRSKLSEKLMIKRWFDAIMLLVIAFFTVMLTGSYQSHYKYLFLLVIASSSIECEMKESLFIAGLSAAMILGIDLVCAPSAGVNTYFESDIVLACVFLIISWTIAYYVNLRKQHIIGLRILANLDGLTGLYNHRYFFDRFNKQFQISKKEESPLSLLFLDIDDFKFYNDFHGHQMGDEVLRTIAQMIKEIFEDCGIAGRYGGEEFTILLPNTDEEAALKKAEQLRMAVQEHPFAGQENLPSKNLTISVGVSTYPTKAKTEAELLKRADEACYRAKFLYKNRVEAYHSILEEL